MILLCWIEGRVRKNFGYDTFLVFSFVSEALEVVFSSNLLVVIMLKYCCRILHSFVDKLSVGVGRIYMDEILI